MEELGRTTEFWLMSVRPSAPRRILFVFFFTLEAAFTSFTAIFFSDASPCFTRLPSAKERVAGNLRPVRNQLSQ